MQKAHTILAQRKDSDRDRRVWRCPAQRCIPDHLSGALSFLSSAEFAAAVSTCSSWHAAGELLSAWPDRAPVTVPGVAASAYIDSSWIAFFTHRFARGGPSSSRSLFAATRGTGMPWQAGPEQFVPAAACSTRIWRHATEATLGNSMSWLAAAGHEGFRDALMAVAALPRIQLIRLSSEYMQADVREPFALLAPKLEMLVCPDYQSPQWLSSIPQLTNLRILSLWYRLLSNPELMLSRLHRLEHLSLTCREDEDDWDDEDDEEQHQRRADEFAMQLGLTIRALSVKHALRSCQLSISGHAALFDALTAPPCSANRWSPLPLLTSLNCDDSDYDGTSQAHRALQLPSLTALHVVNQTPLSALWPDVPRNDRPQGTAAELAQAARTLAQLHTLSRLCSYGSLAPLTPADLAPLRYCSSLRVLQDFVPANQLEEVVAALEEAAAAGKRAAAASSSSASSAALSSHSHSRITRSASRSASFIAPGGPIAFALSSSAPLERMCVHADVSLSLSALAPLHRLRCLRQLVVRPPSGSANWLQDLLEGLAGHPTLESIHILTQDYARATLRLTVRGLRAIIATPSLVRMDVGEDRTMDFAFANQQAKLLSFDECIALRHMCFHFSSSRDGRVGWARLMSDGNGTFRWVGAEGFGVKRSYTNAIVGAVVAVGVGLVAEWWRRRAAAV